MPDPTISAEDIQGNSLAGFNKDHQAFLLVRIRVVRGLKFHIDFNVGAPLIDVPPSRAV